jgi:hypothetical protein
MGGMPKERVSLALPLNLISTTQVSKALHNGIFSYFVEVRSQLGKMMKIPKVCEWFDGICGDLCFL